MVPSDWILNTVDDLFNVHLGKMLNQAAKAQNPQYKYLGNSDVRWGYFDFSALKSMHFNEREKVKFTLQPGDILMCEGGEVGRCSIWYSTRKDLYYQKALHRLRSKGNISPEYFYNFMSFISGTKALDNFTTRTSIAHLTREKLLKIPIKTPPLPEQRKIAIILSTWDKAISTTERLIDNSKQQKKALMQQLLTGNLRLLDDLSKRFEGEWEEVTLTQIAFITMGSSPKSSAYNEENVGLPLLQGNADIKYRKSKPRIYTSEITKECSIGDILLSVRAPVGTVATSIHQACIGRGIAAIQAKQMYSQEFLYQWLLWFEPRWEAFSQGSTFEAVNSNDIKSLHMTIPHIEEQRKIASVLTNADKEIELLEKQLGDLKQEKKALMQQLLTGKRRVKLDEKEVA
jgi:type I restriction enzyme S subunit